MNEVVASSLPQTNATLEFMDGYPPMSPTKGNLALQQELSAINVALGREPMLPLPPSQRGAADISFVAPYTDALAGLGGLGARGHTPDEYVQLSSLPLAIKRAAILMYRLSQTPQAD
jgi:glutamate carboxypeptidase